jgi:hypothetical protein
MSKQERQAESLRRQLEKAGLTQRTAAMALDITDRSMTRYCSGEVEVPMMVTMALRWLEMIHNNDRVIEFARKGARFKYTLAEGGERDVTEWEVARLEEISAKLKAQVKKAARKK